jgi:hypothetical protein
MRGQRMRGERGRAKQAGSQQRAARQGSAGISLFHAGILEPFPFRLNRNGALASCFDAFSLRDPGDHFAGKRFNSPSGVGTKHVCRWN